MHKLFFSGFPLDIAELDLAKLVAPYGDISTIKIVRDRKTKICKGYAFIEMQTLAGAQQVKEALDNTEMAGRYLTVNIVEETPVVTKPQPSSPLSKQNENRYTQAIPRSASLKPKRPRKVL